MENSQDPIVPYPQCGGTHLVVFGPAASGKSSLCNRLSGDASYQGFKVAVQLKACTQKPQQVTVLQFGHSYTVMDTQSFDSDASMTEVRSSLKKLIEDLREHIIQKENQIHVISVSRNSKDKPVSRSVSRNSENMSRSVSINVDPDDRSDEDKRESCKTIIIFCVRANKRTLADDLKLYHELKELWSNSDDFCQRVVVAFTWGKEKCLSEKNPLQRNETGHDDQQEHEATDTSTASQAETTPEQEILEEVKTATNLKLLQEVLKDADDRCVVFNNKVGSTSERPVRTLLDIVNTMEFRTSISPCRKGTSLSKKYKVAIGIFGCVLLASILFYIVVFSNRPRDIGGLVLLAFSWLIGR